MKRLSLLTILLILSVSLLFAATTGPRIWFNNSTMVSKNNLTIDLSKTIYKPRVDVAWNQSNANGTYNSTNYVAQFGVSEISHRLILTIETDGKFISQSDPTKYRNFSMSINPVYNSTASGGGGRLKWVPSGTLTQNSSGAYTNGYGLLDTEYFPNTAATGSATLYTPIANGAKQYVDSTMKVDTVVNYWVDFLICMDPLDTEALKHLAEKDDYIATIYVTWTCADDGAACTETCNGYSHNGSTIFRLRGYYGSADNIKDEAYLYVVPNENTTNINIRALAGSGNTLNIGSLQLHTTPRTTAYKDDGSGQAYTWNSKVYIYASSSPLTTTASSTFTLKQIGGTKTIPYKIVIYSEDGTQKLIEYDGTDYYAVSGNGGTVKNNKYVPLGNMTTTSDRYGNVFSQIDFYGQIHISIPDAINNTDGTYSGAYSSVVYFNILCNV
ncbi:MAG: hypothetical protein MJ057_05930 [Sphaerochaetaceae bacterium]|nr:hypothetical protein [Sphaerochaetaceae bacterium]